MKSKILKQVLTSSFLVANLASANVAKSYLVTIIVADTNKPDRLFAIVIPKMIEDKIIAGLKENEFHLTEASRLLSRAEGAEGDLLDEAHDLQTYLRDTFGESSVQVLPIDRMILSQNGAGGYR